MGFPSGTQIRTSNLNLYYGDFHALKDISMEVGRSMITAFIGPSGCGKSSYLRCLNRMNDFIPGARAEGTIELDGENILSGDVDVITLRRKVGMVFQRPNPFPMSVYENVAYGARLDGIKDRAALDAIVEQSLEHAALWDEIKGKLGKSALGLSGGQQQRLCIARAIATQPEILLMDEPTSALDPMATMRIEELVCELKQKYTVVVVTHNMQQAARISDATAFFLNGELVEYGRTAQIFTLPLDKRTEDYISGRFG